MKKNKFFILGAFALFVMLPFSVNAEDGVLKQTEVLKKDNVVYVISEEEIKCDLEEYNYYRKIENEITLFDYNKHYLYDRHTSTCQELTKEEHNKLTENQYYDYDISYEIKDNKLYKKRVERKNVITRYVPITKDEYDENGVYYVESSYKKFVKIEDNSTIDFDLGEIYYQQLVLMQTETILENEDYYIDVDGGNLAYKKNGNECVNTAGCYEKYDKDKLFKVEEYITDIDTTKFDLKKDGLDNNITDEELITNYFEFNGVKYIVLSMEEDFYNYDFLYTIDGKYIKLNEDYKVRIIEKFNDNYLYYQGVSYDSDKSYTTILNTNFEEIYSWETNYDEMVTLTYFLNENNEAVIGKTTDNVSGPRTNNLLIITKYDLLEGNNQVYDNKDLTFKTNGNYSLFKNIEINGAVLSKNNYIVESGSTIVTLKHDYLKTLENDIYNLKINYNDGGYVEATFEVEKTNIDSSIYNLTFDANGGKFKDGKSTMEIADWTFSMIYTQEEPTRDGYTFKGWYVDKELKTPLLAEPSMTNITTIYAKWEVDEENPKTFDGIGTSIFMGTISLIGLAGATIYLRKKNKVRAN